MFRRILSCHSQGHSRFLARSEAGVFEAGADCRPVSSGMVARIRTFKSEFRIRKESFAKLSITSLRPSHAHRGGVRGHGRVRTGGTLNSPGVRRLLMPGEKRTASLLTPNDVAELLCVARKTIVVMARDGRPGPEPQARGGG